MRFWVVFLAACAGSHEPAAKPTTTSSSTDTPTTTIASPCTEDIECVVSDFGGCCDACPAPLHATARRDLEREQRKCTEVDCAARGRVRCEPTERADAYKAICRDHTCAMEKK